MNRSPRPWSLIAIALLATGGLGSCAGTMMAHYTVTGMLPLGPTGAVPEYLAEERAVEAVASSSTSWDSEPGYSDLSYTTPQAGADLASSY